jgi:hypothetical protein
MFYALAALADYLMKAVPFLGLPDAGPSWTVPTLLPQRVRLPVTLAANTQYYLASQEVGGGDSWYSYNTAVPTTSAATVQTPVYSNDGTSWTPYGTAGS